MSKYQTFEDLQSLGTEKIHEKTHISRDKLELVLTKSYGDIGRVQFMGFLSILEREYGIDLNDIRVEYTAFWEEHGPATPPKESVILQPKSNTKQKWVFAAVVLIAVLMGGGYVLQNFLSTQPGEELMDLTSLAVEPAPAIESNTTAAEESNVTAEAEETEIADANTTAVGDDKTVTIRPVYKVWAGMIDLASGAKTQQITGEPIVIDTTKNWLIVLGHGRVEIETPKGKETLKEKETVRFVYENGSLKQLSREEFLVRNGGKTW